MPRRFNNTVGFSGFNADVANPFYRFPGGRALVSDVDQARESMMFGGDGGLPRASAPQPTHSPTPVVRGTMTTGDRSNAGLVNPRLFRHDNAANTEFWVGSSPNPNRPHTAIPFEDTSTRNASVSAGATVPQYPATGSVFDEVPGYSYSVGEPTVQTPRMAGSSLDLDTAPSLFDDAPMNPFDQWWKTPTDAPSVTVNAGDSGGSIWSGEETLSNFGQDVALGNDLNADLGALGYGEDYPAIETPVSDEPPMLAEGTGIPVEPDPLNQDVGDLEWTTSENDRRFLPGSEPESVEPVPTRSLTLGPNIRDFGGHSFGTPLTLGAYLNMPLASLQYGEGYEIPFGGRPDDLQAGEGYIAPGAQQAGGHWVDVPGGQLWVEDSGGGEGTQPNQPSTPAPETATPEVRRAEAANSRQQSPITAILQQFPNLNSPASIRALQSGARPQDLMGRNQFDSRAANLSLMSAQAQHQPVNAFNPDELTDNRPGMIGRLDDFGNYVQTGNISGGWAGHESSLLFAYGSQGDRARSRARGRMAPPGRGG